MRLDVQKSTSIKKYKIFFKKSIKQATMEKCGHVRVNEQEYTVPN